ncbi:MAG TPA: tetratricopeptide repeat protein [Longimicrobiales bacterium]|nr:tetratricopeptide repeat protein [Longimicrobiales bacterium]
MSLRNFFGELRRRHVLRVVGAYAVAAWVFVEVYTTVQPILLEEQEWTNRLVVILALAGFPVAFALAWIFDITPDGVRRTLPLSETVPGVDRREAATPVPVPVRRRPAIGRASGFFGLGILVALVAVAAYAGYHHEGRGTAGPDSDAPIESIAVLPFVDMSPGQDQEFFSDGVTEELLNRLATVPDLRVAARTSSFVFKGSAQDVREIGRRLGVQSVLEGSVRREGDRLRVSTKLIDVATGYQIWSDRFDGEATDVFALQDAIAGAVVDALRQRFAAAPEAGRRGTTSVRAYELYLLGLRRANARNDRDLRQAVAYFQDALQEDPQFALAYAGLAQAYAMLPVYGSFPVDSAVVKGSTAAAQAIAYDPSMADAYAAMGQLVQNFEWDFQGAESYYRRALRYQPGNATTHQWFAETLMLQGRYADAEIHVRSLLATDPLAPSALFSDAYLKMLRGRMDEAMATWRDLVRIHPDFAAGVANHAYAAVAAGDAAEAATSVDRLADLAPQHARLYGAIAAALRGGGTAAAVRELQVVRGIHASERVAWLMALRSTDAALTALEAAFDLHEDVSLPFIMVHPLLTPVRDAGGFSRMATELGLGLRT